MSRTATLLACCALALSCKISCFAPRSKVIDAPIAATLHGATTGETYDHSEFDGLLRRFARPDSGRVDYAGLAAEVARLDAYLARLGEVDLARLGRDAQKALLINAYNAFTLRLILDHYPGIESIKDLSSPWKAKRWQLAGELLSLDDIEHGLLRPIYGDARIHFAVNCASIGCPPLADFAYVGPELDAQLDLVTRAVLNDPRYARVEVDAVRVTALMNWYGPDFGDVEAFVAKYRDDLPRDAQVKFLDYDWHLNDVAPPANE